MITTRKKHPKHKKWLNYIPLSTLIKWKRESHIKLLDVEQALRRRRFTKRDLHKKAWTI